jgi:hypothetical protein
MAFAAIVEERVPDQILRRITLEQNPWQLFVPRRGWIPIEPTAAAAPTLTAAVAHNLGSTTVTPRVTFTR